MIQQERLARIKADTLAGKLVEASSVAVEWAGVLREVRAALLAVPGRIRGRLPHLSPSDAETIDSEIRSALTGLADAGKGPSP
jgi:phage terminase Nu1 subunit (DNA packaging protein)